LLVPFGKVADTFGRRPVLIFSLGLFSVFSLVAGFAKNATYLDIVIGVMGLVSAGAIPSAIGILGEAYERPSKRKNLAFAGFGAGNPMGTMLGSIFSGVAAHLFSWRASFYLLSMIYFVVFLIAIWSTPKTQTETAKSTLRAISRLDVLGILLSMSGIGLFCCSLT
jgi:MFS family permease